METKNVQPRPGAPKRRADVRALTADEFIERHASGTLRKNKRLGFAWRGQYLHERVAFEFGWGFEILPVSRVTFGDARTEGDCSAITEAGWHIDRIMSLSSFEEDVYQTKYVQIETPEGRREGIGVVLKETSAPWVPAGHLVFAIIAEYDPKTHDFLCAQNPM